MNFLLKHYKPILTTLLIAVVVFGFGESAWAAWDVIVQCWWDAAIEENGSSIFLMSLFLNFISRAWMIPAVLAGELMSNDLIYGQLVWLEHYFYQFWTLMRTIANFALVAIIIMIIGKVLKKPWEYMKVIGDYGPRVLMSGVLINMSWFLMWVAVDVSTVAVTWIWQVWSQFMTKTLGLDKNTQDSDNKKNQWIEGLVQAIPSKITINDCGCLVATTPEKNNPNKTRENLVEKRNNLAGPLIFLWAGVMKLQAYSTSYDCNNMAAVKKELGKNVLKVILTTFLALMFIVPLIVLVAFNLFRLIYLRWWIIFSPLIVLINIFDEEAKILDIDSKTKEAISWGTMFTGLLQPLFTSWALIIWMMLIIWVYDATRIGSTIDGASNQLNGIANTRTTSQIDVDNVWSITMIDSIISDPTGTIGWGFGYLLLAVATCMVLWMLVKMSFTISKWWVWAAMWFDAEKMMGTMRGEFMKRVKLPDIWWPLWGASLNEAASLLDPTDKNNKIMKKLDDIGSWIKKSGIAQANKWLENSWAWELLGMQDNGDLVDGQSLSSLDWSSPKDSSAVWTEKTKWVFDSLKKFAWESSKKTFKVDRPDRKSYEQLKKWYNDDKWWWKAILSKFEIDNPDKPWEKMKLPIPDFDKEYNVDSYVWWLIKYLSTTDKVKLDKDGKLDWKLSKTKLTDINFKGL